MSEDTPPTPPPSRGQVWPILAMIALIGVLLLTTAVFLLLAACGVLTARGGAPPTVAALILFGYFAIAGLSTWGIVAMARRLRRPAPESTAAEVAPDTLSDAATARLRFVVLASIVLSLGLWVLSMAQAADAPYLTSRWRAVSAAVWLAFQAPYALAALWLEPARDRGLRVAGLILTLAYAVASAVHSVYTLVMIARYATSALQVVRGGVGILVDVVLAALAIHAWAERPRPASRLGQLLLALLGAALYSLAMRSLSTLLYSSLGR